MSAKYLNTEHIPFSSLDDGIYVTHDARFVGLPSNFGSHAVLFIKVGETCYAITVETAIIIGVKYPEYSWKFITL